MGTAVQHPLPGIRLLIFDLDGTLRYCIAHGGPCHNHPGEWRLYDDVPAIVAVYNGQTMALGIASNQAGIGLGYIPRLTVREEMMATVSQALGNAHWHGQFHASICPHVPEEGCACRKPQPGMIFENMLHANVGPSATLFVGDSVEDAEAAERAGCHFMTAWDFFGREKPPWATWNDEKRHQHGGKAWHA